MNRLISADRQIRFVDCLYTNVQSLVPCYQPSSRPQFCYSQSVVMYVHNSHPGQFYFQHVANTLKYFEDPSLNCS